MWRGLLQVIGYLRLRHVNQQQNKIGIAKRNTRPPHAFHFDTVVRLPKSSSVIKLNQIAINIEINLQDVAGGSGNLRHDCDVTTRQGVQQA